jgi:hypothetical protein
MVRHQHATANIGTTIPRTLTGVSEDWRANVVSRAPCLEKRNAELRIPLPMQAELRIPLPMQGGYRHRPVAL